jgi:transposase
MAILAQVEAGTSIAQVAREHGLHPSMVARWKGEYKEDPEMAFAGPGHPYKDQSRIAELERMVGQLYAENLFLKKTLDAMNQRVEEERRRSRRRRDTK